MPKGIAIVGLNGSGKTTLGRALAKRLGYYRMDVEDYYFPKSDVPYAVARTREEVEHLMLADIAEHGDFVLSAVCADFAAIEPFYELIVYLEAPQNERMERIRQRSVDKFGSRVLPGGDMYEQEESFFAFAAKRTPDKIEKWIKTVACPVLRIDSRKPTEELVRCVICFLKGEKSCKRRKEIPF
ncbi:MAG: AAA family ATPase [Clostridia bacterium]|nr:AAA family ATPase [Clostridia bacterium]